MREIKFRAWDNYNKKFIYDIFTNGKINCIIKEINHCGDYISNEVDYNSFDIMQCTGLKDKYGEEIYEGDILKICNEEITLVKWDEQIAGFDATIKWADRGWREQVTDHQDTVEIIGSICQNPELLKNEM